MTMNALAPLSARGPWAHAQPAVAKDSTLDAQSLLAKRLATRLGLSEEALSGASANDFTPEKVAGRVLEFIEKRLSREAQQGANPEKLQGLLEQARKGVEQGFVEARKVLDGLGVLQGKLAEDIDSTYQKIDQGLAQLGQKFLPQESSQLSAQGLAAAYQSERFSASAQTFDLSVTTKEGDRLRISMAQASSSYQKTSAAYAENAQGSAWAVQSQSTQMRIGAFQIEVQGDLNEQEQRALSSLLNQVGDLSEQFYRGDLAGAFDKALALNLDGSQLASLSLFLTQTKVRQVSESYGRIAQSGAAPAQEPASAINQPLVDYAKGLLEALKQANQLADDGQGLLEQLLAGQRSTMPQIDASAEDKASTLTHRLLQGLSDWLADKPAAEAAL